MLNIILFSRLYVIINDKMPFILVFILFVFLIVFVENDVILTVNNKTFKLYYLYCIFLNYIIRTSLHSQDSGVIPWKEGDLAIIFCKST